MADISRRIVPGQPISGFPADSMNYMMEGARLAHQQESGVPSGVGFPKDVGVIWIRNDSATDPLPAYSILGIEDAVVFDETDDELSYKEAATFKGVEPTEADHEAKFCVTLEPLMEGFRGEAVAVGVVFCKVDITDESHEFADVTDGEVEHLTSGESGYARILRKPSGTGVKDCIVRLAGGGGGTSTTSLTDGCECDGDSLVQGVPLDGDGAPTQICCTGHERFTITILGSTYTMYHAGNNVWSTFNSDSALDNPVIIDCSESSESPLEDEYDIKMTITATGGTVELVARAALNCDAVCFEYERSTVFGCQKSNQFNLTKFSGADGLDLPVCVCVVPVSTVSAPDGVCGGCFESVDDIPRFAIVTVRGVGEPSAPNDCDGGCCCSNSNGVFVLPYSNAAAQGGQCTWYLESEGTIGEFGAPVWFRRVDYYTSGSNCGAGAEPCLHCSDSWVCAAEGLESTHAGISTSVSNVTCDDIAPGAEHDFSSESINGSCPSCIEGTGGDCDVSGASVHIEFSNALPRPSESGHCTECGA